MTRTATESFPVRDAIREMTAYTLERRIAELKLDQNEAPEDWNAEFKSELARRITARSLNRYPEFGTEGLRDALSRHYGLPSSSLLVGNGSNELLLTAFATFVTQGTRVVLPAPSFALYEKLARVFGAEIVSIPVDPLSGLLPVAELCNAATPESIVVVCSPNNPTGGALQPGDLERLLDRGGMVFLDRAYGEFACDAIPPLHDRLVTFSTFSKAWGLAALRIGWLASTEENCRQLAKVKLPYNLNVASEEAALLALDRSETLDERVRATILERERVAASMLEVPGIRPFPSSANFISFQTAIEPKELSGRLLSRGILVRDISRYAGMKECLRVSIGSREENDRFLAALREVSGQEGEVSKIQTQDQPVPATRAAVKAVAVEPSSRSASVSRKTKETSIEVSVDLDSRVPGAIETPVGFLSHMLDVIAKHGWLSLNVRAAGDVEIDYHHTVEDVALVLGEAFRRALGDKRGIARFGHAYVPLDESLARVVIDFSGRPFLEFEAPLDREMLLIHKDFPFALVEEFFKSFANACACNVHVDLLRGRNGHHAAEAIFKAFAIALRSAKTVVSESVPSTKGVI